MTSDESADIYLVLKCPYTDEDNLRSFLPSLVISIEAQVINGGVVPGRDVQPASEIIYSGTLAHSIDATILVRSSKEPDADGEDGYPQYAIAVWKQSVFLGRPRMRLQSPSVVFTATANLRSADPSLSLGLRHGYLPACVPSGINLLEPFEADPFMNGIKPHLSAQRVSRVAPATQQAQDILRPIKSLSNLPLRIYPVAHSRMRFTHLNTAPSTATVLAMLEIDFTPFFECEVIISKISIVVADGIVEDLTSQSGMQFPVSCVAHDHVTFLYRITPVDADMATKNPVRDLGVSISATALAHPNTCEPSLSMAWTATVDFTVPVNPGYGSAMQPIQRKHRPSQLSIGGESTTSLIAPSVARPDSLPTLEAATRTEATVPDIGITMTFTGPPPSQKIYPGDEFVWNIFVVNRSLSPTAAARKLAIVAIPRRRRNESRVTQPPSISRISEALHGQHPQLKGARDRNIADAVFDDNVVHAMQYSSVIDNTELVCLSADVRVGPLASGACHVAELRFLALRGGIVGLEAVRVIDLANNEHVDIRELPTVLVEDR